MAERPIRLTVNGQLVDRVVPAGMLLAEFLRETLGLTGTHVGCDTTQCGVCTVLMDDEPVKSCTVLAVQADGARITTVEGLASDGGWHPVQQAFHQEHGLQCGFCTPGALMLAAGMLREKTDWVEHEVRAALDGLICRCTGYEHIVRAILTAQSVMAEQGGR